MQQEEAGNTAAARDCAVVVVIVVVEVVVVVVVAVVVVVVVVAVACRDLGIACRIATFTIAYDISNVLLIFLVWACFGCLFGIKGTPASLEGFFGQHNVSSGEMARCLPRVKVRRLGDVHIFRGRCFDSTTY